MSAPESTNNWFESDETILRHAVMKTSSKTGEDFLLSIVEHLASALHVRYAFLGKLVGSKNNRVETIAVWNNGSIGENIEYELAGTPCDNVVGQKTCFYPRTVQAEFPEDYLLVEMGVESYLGTPLFDSAGRPLGILAALDDKPMPEEIGPQVALLLELFAARASAEIERQKAESQYEMLFDSMLDGCALHDMIFDKDGRPVDYRFRAVNSAFERLTGLKADDLLGKTVREAMPHIEESWIEAYGSVVLTGRPHRFEEYTKELDKHFEVVAFRPAEGQFACVFADVTSRKKAESEREELIAELEAKNAELERFTYTVSHDLKTPLITLNGYMGVLREDIATGNEEGIEDNLRRMAGATDTMSQLLSELLELSRIGRLMNPPEDVPLDELVGEAVELVSGPINQRGVSVSVSANLPTVRGDRRRLVEVLQNLIDNAVKHMGDQPEPLIKIGADVEGDEAICRVSDNGAGIDPRYHEKIFGLFEKLDNDTEGTGVGLALVKRIVEVHKGRIWVESDGNGSGTTFFFALPLAQE